MKTVLFTALFTVTALPFLTQGAMANEGTNTENPTSTAIAPLTYEMFETAIAHVDLESCPAEFNSEIVFCRMTLNEDQAHVFVFPYDGDQKLLAIKSYGLESDFLRF
jgi:hypothetical protein